MGSNLEIELLILALLLVSSIVTVLGRRFGIPYTVALVLAGLVLALRSQAPIEISPELLLSLFLPPLLFEAAFYLNFEYLRNNLHTIAILAIPGVVLNMLLVGGVVSWGAGLPISIALVFGALIAATDPVAVVSIFRRLGAPKRLEILLEGESLLNDGTAIVIFNLTLATLTVGHFNLLDGVIEFVRVGGGGLLVGLALGWIVSRLIARIDDHLVETTLTTVLAFGSFLVAEQLEVSGVLAVVAAGIVSGNIGPGGMSPTTRIVVGNFWEYAAYLANSAVFLLIGLQMDLPALLASWRSILWAIGAVLGSRAVVVYLLSRLGSSMPATWRHVLFWGGLRGAIALALALSLPADLGPERETVILMTFGVVLFSVIGQGSSMGRLLSQLKIVTRSEEQIEFESRRARVLATRAGYNHIKRLSDEGLISTPIWETLEPVMKQRLEVLTTAVQEGLQNLPDLEAQELLTARREIMRAQRSMLGTLRRDGIISDETYGNLVVEIDTALESGLEIWKDQVLAGMQQEDICQLIMAVVQTRDIESALNALANRGVRATRIQSTGGYLRQRNHLLLIGIPEGRLEMVVDALKRSSRSRVEFLATPFEGASDVIAQPTEVTIRGATVFALNVEHCEEL